jgi:beta-aspartyl-peptidase (threonine type)
MFKSLHVAPALVVVLFFVLTVYSQNKARPAFRLAIHGGAGAIARSKMTPELEAKYRADLERALRTGHDVLEKGGTSLDAVVATFEILEDSPLFNAGKGAVFTHDGKNELDAAIMDGATLKAGAVAGVQHIKNPIALARLVMDRSIHVMLTGDGAEQFAKENGVKLVDAKYFYTEQRWKGLQDTIREEDAERKAGKKSAYVVRMSEDDDHKFGTVGCVALDRSGNLAAGTSTGGLTNKRYGRIGDSPIIGAGTYANNRTCAVSGTGTGEFFIRANVAYDISALMEYKGLSVAAAADEVVMDKLVKLGGDGGVIAMDHDGNIAMPFNTEGMYRGWIDEDGKVTVEIYK